MYNVKGLLKLVVVLLIPILILTNCSDDKDGVSPNESEYIYVHWDNDSVKVSFEGLPTIDVDGESAIQLSSFINRDFIPDTNFIIIYTDKDGDTYEGREIYSYQVVGEDGFSASMKGYLHNSWEQMGMGFILNANRNVVFPDNVIDLPGAYNVKTTRHIKIYRKFDLIVTNPDTTYFFNLDDFATTIMNNHDGQPEPAIPFSSFINQAVLDSLFLTPESKNYNMEAIDNFGPSSDMTWDQFQTGYYLLDSHQTIFTDTSLAGGRYKVKEIKKIMVN